MMKDMSGGGGSGGDGVSSSSNKLQSATSSSSNGGGVVLRPQGNIRKNRKPEDVQLLLRRLKQYLLYSKLRSLIPSPTQPQQPFDDDHQLGERHEEVTEVEMELHEIPIAYKSDSDHDEENSTSVIAVIPKTNTNMDYNLVLETKQEEDEDEEEDGTCITTIVFENDDDEEEKQPEKAFVPSVKIERMDNTILINTVVLKQKALTSSLFKILEEDENLDIVFENQYRTETKVCHTIQVRLIEPTAAAAHQYNVDRLEKRLQKWAKGEPEPETEPML